MPRCCYSSTPRGGNVAHCQFGQDNLTKVDDLWFCDFHLPWSLDDLNERYVRQLHSDHQDAKLLKSHWGQSQVNQLNARAFNILRANQDLTGYVAPGDFASDEHLPQARLDDSYFPAVFRLGAQVNDLRLAFSVFCGETLFQSGVPTSLDLRRGVFREAVSFQGRQFGEADFQECVFNKSANFKFAEFARSISFKFATFRNDADFSSANFNHSFLIDFSGVTIGGEFRLRAGVNNPKLGPIKFRNAEFLGQSGFEGRIFTSTADFRGVKFHRAPRFQDCTTSFEAVLPKISGFLDRTKVPKGISSETSEIQKEYYEDAAQSYRTLRFEMKEQEAHDEEAMFWELEMTAKEHALSWRFPDALPKLLSKLYGVTARYGNSIGRPLLFWFLSIVLFANWFALFSDTFSFKIASSWLQVLDLSFQQTVRPFARLAFGQKMD